MEETRNLYDNTAFGLRVAVIPAGSFESEDGRNVEYSRGIKLQIGKRSIKISALQCLALKQILQDVDFDSTIKPWAVEEKSEYESQLKALKGF